MQKSKRQLPVPFHTLGEEIRLYWVFRVLQGLAVLLAFLADGEAVLWAPRHREIGVLAAAVFVSAGLAMFGVTYLRRLRADVQFYTGAALDLVFTNVVLYAAPGAIGMVLLLLITCIAASSLFIHLRFGMAIALASIATIFLHRLLSDVAVDGPSPHNLSYFALGYLAIALLFIALILGRIGIKLFWTDRIATERGEEIADLSALTQQVLKRLPIGVLVVDGQGDIQASNESARELMQLPEGEGRHSLPVNASGLHDKLQEWSRDPEAIRTPLTMGADARQIEPQFLPLHPGSDEVLIFLEDTSQAARRAETITLATLGRFSASLAHEIRNPLSAIKYSAQLLRESSHLDVMDRRMLDIIQQQIQRMNGIIDSVLGLARREKANPETFDLTAFLNDFVAEYSAGFPLDNDTLALRVPPTAVTVFADPRHIHQILMVLISNARYYGRQPQAPAVMALVLRVEPGGQVTIDVTDEGPGIAEQAQKSLFRPFFTTSGHGTGLGLYIARELAQANGGDLKYLRRAGGSCFRLGLPAAGGA